ncbi:MAG: hypothetical protein IPI77_23455 [Saprospiraceae bacterium]|nr:hypothetical protein [Saprospiraceae bacterium]
MKTDRTWIVLLLINALALKMSDQEEQGNTLLESWQGRIPDSPYLPGVFRCINSK